MKRKKEKESSVYPEVGVPEYALCFSNSSEYLHIWTNK